MIYRHSVVFGNPYKDPPRDFPRILVAIETDCHHPPERFEQKRIKILKRLEANGIRGFYLGFDCDPSDKKRTWSDEAKKKNRLRRLRKRLSKKYSIPELLDDAINQSIANNPDYYT